MNNFQAVDKMEASYYEKLEDEKVRCVLCPNFCVIADGRKGMCRIRVNHNGKLYAEGYAEVVSLSLDPVEKKPLYHFYPGKAILSTGPNGCNFRCGFCQNSEISQKDMFTRHVEPSILAAMATESESIGIAYTYSEPLVWFEYIRDAGNAVKELGLVNVLVSNGYVNEDPFREILPLIDAMNIDLKSMNHGFYTKICGGNLDDVKRTIEIASGACHVELTNLVITNNNDSDEDFEEFSKWVASVNPNIPVHFSRYFPSYKFNEAPTKPERLMKAYEIASSYLNYVYVGNMSFEGSSDTYCPDCRNILIKRTGYSTDVTGIIDGKCNICSRKADVIGI